MVDALWPAETHRLQEAQSIVISTILPFGEVTNHRSAVLLLDALRSLETRPVVVGESQHARVLDILIGISSPIQTPCVEVFSYFLLFCSQWLNDTALSEVFLLLCVYMDCLDEQGQKTLDRVRLDQEDDLYHQGQMSPEELGEDNLDFILPAKQPNKQPVPGQSFCLSETAEVVADLATVFFCKYIPRAVSGPHAYISSRTALRVLGTSKSHKLNSVCLIKFLCNWLYKFGFTLSTVELNKVNSVAKEEDCPSVLTD